MTKTIRLPEWVSKAVQDGWHGKNPSFSTARDLDAIVSLRNRLTNLLQAVNVYSVIPRVNSSATSWMQRFCELDLRVNKIYAALVLWDKDEKVWPRIYGFGKTIETDLARLNRQAQEETNIKGRLFLEKRDGQTLVLSDLHDPYHKFRSFYDIRLGHVTTQQLDQGAIIEDIKKQIKDLSQSVSRSGFEELLIYTR